MSTFMLWNILNAASTIQQPLTTPAQPNILLILADDLGWNDVGWHNRAMLTPNLDRLAYAGVILNQTYATPVCSPSRAALLTGRYPFTMGMQHGTLKPKKPRGLPLGEKLLPEALRELGYRTHIVGKWHLGFCNWAYTPTYRGFDSFYGFYNGQSDYFTHRTAAEKGYDFRFNTKINYKAKHRYSTNMFARRAIDIISHHDKEKPLFLYMPFQAVHSPLQVPKKYEYMYPSVRNRARRVFNGMVTALDEAVGMVMKALKKRKMIDNTLVIFLSDNGGTPYQGGNNYPLRGGKGTLWEGGTRVPGFVWGRMLQRTGYTNNQLLHITDWFPTILSLAGGKPDANIDGINQLSTISKNATSERNEFVYAINEISNRGAIRIGDYKLIVGSPGHYSGWYSAPQGRSSTLKKHEMESKVLHRGKADKHLYNIKDDPEEKHDLAHKMPELVEQMEARLRDHYWSQLVPSFNPRKVRKAQPKFWDNVWSPGWCSTNQNN